MATLHVRLSDEDTGRLIERSEELDMGPEQYISLCLNVCECLPQYLLFAVAAGVPVSFYAAAGVGDTSGE